MTDYFTKLEQELVSAVTTSRSSSGGGAPQTRRGLRSPRGAALVATGLLLLVAVPAVALTGAFEPKRETDGLVRLSEPQRVASGTTTDGRDWELRASESSAGFCLALQLPPDLPGGGRNIAEGCGGGAGALDASTASGGSNPANALVYGTASDDAARVRVTSGDVSVVKETVDDDVGVPGRFFFVELPLRSKLGPTRVEALSSDGARVDVIEP